MLNTRIVVTRNGGQDVLEVVEESLRAPNRGEIRIKVQIVGVALADIMRREGVYPMSPVPPFTPGYDAVGTVEELGEDVDQYAKGDKVCVLFDGTGGYAAYVYAKVQDLVKVPESVDPAQAAAIILNYVTAYQMLHRLAKVKEGDSILVHGASGGVGTALLELGKLAKVKMYGTASSAKHPIVSRYGATPIDYRTEDFVEVLGGLAPGGVEAVFDPIGGSNWQRSIQTLSSKGRFIGYGYTSVLSEANPEEWIKDWKIFSGIKQTQSGNGVYLYSITTLRKEQPEWFHEDLSLLFKWLEQGKISPIVSHKIPLREAANAHRIIEEFEAVGKVVLTV
ncbi:medium chain dehydrogenase/reductase family protein [Ammoniphilus sp. CFH 90114]|uniref:medium chain dehydrogenase/reductase family protein n=1 Tax=Ammoniphilus sp. CFH 90114 TaxID=2493665 RepID=UPI00100F1A55|nr:medium chain dehydrogenase/reductase family protein [Ammoniphilus sp. CFH 90114]RXT02824.1 alcohol dehydrogenase [Ammoniphilus sp. CFH 90114]